MRFAGIVCTIGDELKTESSHRLQALSLSSVIVAAHAKKGGGTVTVYSDAECKHQIQVVQFSEEDVYQCKEFSSQTAQSVRFSTDGFDNLGFNVWVRTLIMQTKINADLLTHHDPG